MRHSINYGYISDLPVLLLLMYYVLWSRLLSWIKGRAKHVRLLFTPLVFSPENISFPDVTSGTSVVSTPPPRPERADSLVVVVVCVKGTRARRPSSASCRTQVHVCANETADGLVKVTVRARKAASDF